MPRQSPAAAAIALVVAGLLAGCVEHDAPASSVDAPQAPVASSAEVRGVEAMTERLLSLADERETAPAEQQTAIEQEMASVAEQRQQALAAVAEQDPAAAVGASLPEEARARMPAEVQAMLEARAELTGRLQVVHFDRPDGTHHHSYAIDTGDGTIGLSVPGEGPALAAQGAEVRARGVRVGQRLAVAETSDLAILLADGTATVESGTGTMTASAPAQVVKKVAVILFNFRNNAAQPWTADFIRTETFTGVYSANAYYRASSHDRLGLAGKVRTDGDVFGWFTIPYDDTNCLTNWRAWSNSARERAIAGGVDLAGYDHIVYGFHPTSGCPGAGWAGIGTEAWVTSYTWHVVTHELGHTMGLDHANGYRCTANGVPVAISSTCTIVDYGDAYDVMGNTKRHLNVFHKGRLNVLDAAATQTVTASGTYAIVPTEQAAQGVKSLRVARDASTYYYLEFRQPYDTYDSFRTTDPVVNGVSIRIAPSYASIASPLLLDMTPGTTSYYDAALLVNQTFTDPQTSITIRTLSAGPSGASVSVQLGASPCVRANPTVSVSPANQSGKAGETLSYSVLVTNRDAGCASSTFRLQGSLPAGWSQVPASVDLALQSGYAGSVSLQVKAAGSSAPGAYRFTQSATDLASATHAGSGTAVFNVIATATAGNTTTNPTAPATTTTNTTSTTNSTSNATVLPSPTTNTTSPPANSTTSTGGATTPPPADTAPPAVRFVGLANGTKLPSRGSVKIEATASDAGGMRQLEILIDGAVVRACGGVTYCQANWAMSRVAPGPHTVTARATDTAGNVASASVTVSR